MLRTIVLLLTLSGFAIAQTSGALYGHVLGVYPNQSVTVGKIDTSSGAITPIATLDSFGYYASSVAAFDTATHRYFAYVYDPSGSLLVTANLQTGAVTSSAPAFSSFWPSTLQFDSSAGVLYGTIYAGSSPTGWESLVKIDLNTQDQLPVATIASGAVWVPQGVSAFDSTTHNYYVFATVGSATNIYTINTQTGRVTASAPVSAIPTSLQFDPTRRRLVGLVYLSGTEYVASFDPSSGAITPLAVAAPASGFISAMSAYQPAPSRYFYYLGSQLTSVSLATGSVKFGSATNPMPLALEFDPQP